MTTASLGMTTASLGMTGSLCRRLARGTASPTFTLPFAQRAPEFIAQIVPGVSTAKRDPPAAANESAPEVSAAVWREQQGDASPDREPDDEPGGEDSGLATLAVWCSRRPIGSAKSGRRAGSRFVRVGSVR
jgi:hypothetical protein